MRQTLDVLCKLQPLAGTFNSLVERCPVGMQASDIKRLRELEEENRRSKQISADLLVEKRALKDVIAKKAITPAVKRELVVTLPDEHGLSERRACAAVNLRRSVNRYRCRPNRDGELVELLLQLAHQRPEEGFPKLFKRLRRARAGVGITNAYIACIAAWN